jgi:hypothetical protein
VIPPTAPRWQAKLCKRHETAVTAPARNLTRCPRTSPAQSSFVSCRESQHARSALPLLVDFVRGEKIVAEEYNRCTRAIPPSFMKAHSTIDGRDGQ